ncbi:hypothetical protein BpHYR1_040060 [Brachionus plicatilis]|uniref:Uncharacterized protein n=1 Tax=Brachionus plicatilis TaxID=10195 RepID=A0A3M7RWR3_BRAPC|nr:hypothetical protein BpHYR1_040060 [Brachionus plicatilis]
MKYDQTDHENFIDIDVSRSSGCARNVRREAMKKQDPSEEIDWCDHKYLDSCINELNFTFHLH